MAVPLSVGGQFSGMLAAVVSLDPILQRLKETSVRGRVVFVVDRSGHIVAHPDTRQFVPGTDARGSSEVVAQVTALPEELSATETVQQFTQQEDGREVPMIGTYSTIPDLNWAVVAERSLEVAREDAGVNELNAQALKFVLAVAFGALVLGYLFAVGISTPIRALAASTQAISRGEFHERAPVRGAAEISELAETFNSMAGDIEQFIERLKQAANENRELFLNSIRMVASAIDEKDPYTRGHSGRVAKYSLILARELNQSEEEIEKLRVSALLHDVGKIGVDDRILKKPGKLTDEEFDQMKEHPAKGANIMRPVAQLKDMIPGIELHHERIDGQGYPYGLKDADIPMMARIIAVADAVDAITTDRPYHSGHDLEYALKEIRNLTGKRYAIEVVDALEAAMRAGRFKLAAKAVELVSAPVGSPTA
jgi:putative nucleotidyltransferase with HDIG domain